jgi:hypothetical protein
MSDALPTDKIQYAPMNRLAHPLLVGFNELKPVTPFISNCPKDSRGVINETPVVQCTNPPSPQITESIRAIDDISKGVWIELERNRVHRKVAAAEVISNCTIFNGW